MKTWKPAIKETQGLSDMVQEQEVQTISCLLRGHLCFPPAISFIYLRCKLLLMGVTSPKILCLPQKLLIDWNATVWAAQSSQVLHYGHEALGRFAQLKQKSALELVTRCSLALLSMESQSIQSMESKVIHLFLKEMLKTEQMNCIIKTLIFFSLPGKPHATACI